MSKYRTMLDDVRLATIKRAVQRVQGVKGNFAELGVYQGGVAKLLTTIAPERGLHLFDTFTGMPDIAGPEDEHKAGDFGDVNLRNVQDYVNNPNAYWFQGVFTGAPLAEEVEDASRNYSHNRFQYALVHLDADLYKSTAAGLRYFWPRLSHGGIMILDDWFWPNCPGVLQAVSEYFVSRLREANFRSEAPYQLTVEKL